MHLVAPLQHYRESAVGFGAGSRRHAVHHFALQHKVLVNDAGSRLHEVKQQRRGDVVGEVSDNAHALFAGYGRPVKRERIGLNEREFTFGKLGFKPGSKVAVDLHGVHMSGAAHEFTGERCLPRADFHDEFPGLRVNSARNS